MEGWKIGFHVTLNLPERLMSLLLFVTVLNLFKYRKEVIVGI